MEEPPVIDHETELGGDEPFVSYAQNGEDVVLWRALRHVRRGNYIDVGAAEPVQDSVTKAFYDRGWSGINVEPLPIYAAQLRHHRERDLTIEAAAGESTGEVAFYGVPNSGLSSLSHDAAVDATHRGLELEELVVQMRRLDDIAADRFSPGEDIHFLKVDVEGAEETALKSFDLQKWRPWVVVVEATQPSSTASTRDSFEYILLEAGYEPTLFDGLNVYYVSADHPELAADLAYPACPLDGYVLDRERALTRRVLASDESSLKWRAAWSGAHSELLVERAQRAAAAKQAAQKVAVAIGRAKTSERKLKAIQNSPFWKASAPARRIRRKLRAARLAKTAPTPKAGTQADLTAGTPSTSSSDLIDALRSRLLAVLQQFEPGLSPDTELPDLERIAVTELADSDAPAEFLWLAYIAYCASIPTDEQMQMLLSRLRLDGPTATMSVLASKAFTSVDTWAATSTMDIVLTPMVDVSHTASAEVHTGIQRVVRSTVPLWKEFAHPELVKYDEVANVWRRLNTFEQSRVLNWGEREQATDSTSTSGTDAEKTIVVPFRTTLISPELSGGENAVEALISLAKWSGTDVSLIFYDMIPLSFSESYTSQMHGTYARYMSVVRHATRISTISHTAAEDLSGFRVSFRNQGIPGPEIRANLLPVQARHSSADDVAHNRGALEGVPGLPIVLSVASIEPRKNQITTLLAAESLWREGLSFQLVFLGGNSWKQVQFENELSSARERGRPVKVVKQASEDLLWAAYRLSRFTVFVSLTEGFGLPAAESIAAGTPVVISGHGSMAEIAQGGGALQVDPYNVNAVADAMRALLTDDRLLEKLQSEARSRVLPTWDDYAASTWNWLVLGLEDELP